MMSSAKKEKLENRFVQVKRCDYCNRAIKTETVPCLSEVMVICCLSCAVRGVKLYAFAKDPEAMLFTEDPRVHIKFEVIFASPKGTT